MNGKIENPENIVGVDENLINKVVSFQEMAINYFNENQYSLNEVMGSLNSLLLTCQISFIRENIMPEVREEAIKDFCKATKDTFIRHEQEMKKALLGKVKDDPA